MTTIGIDIGGSSVKGVMLTGDGWRKAQSKAYTDPDRAALISAVRSVSDQLGGEACCVGMCAPGKQSCDGNCIEYSANLPALNGWYFTEMFSACGLVEGARVYSDAIAAGADFVRTNALLGRVACISMGTGVGLGVFDDGVSIDLVRCDAKHFGAIKVDAGKTLESVVGIPALRERFGDDIRGGIAAMGKDDRTIRAVVRMIRMVLELYSPRSVVLMGGIGITLAQHAEMIDRLVREELAMDSSWAVRFGDSVFHAAMGAARLAQDG